MVGLALTPSLLPRPWFFQGLIAGVSAAIGYGLGVLVGWAFRRTTPRRPGPRASRIAWRVLAVVGTAWLAVAVVAGARWQNEVRSLIGEEQDTSATHAYVALLTIGVGALILAVARMVRRFTRLVNVRLERFLPLVVARTAGVVIVAMLGYLLATGPGADAFMAWADRTYGAVNDGTPPGATQPQSSLRSGSSASEVTWDSLGFHGRRFVSDGPTRAEIAEFTGSKAVEPIRVFVGLDSAPTAAERADLAVRELERTGAFDREVLVVAGATGRGWIDPLSADSLEYMWGGRTAIATIQYSFLPSWMSFIVDQKRATDASRALFDAVHAKWSALPADDRPELIAYGLSLGSFAGQSAFESVADITARTDGALFMGTPNFTEPWQSVVRNRDRGSPEWQPVYGAGETVRFANARGELSQLPTAWTEPRVVYMQHASDPIVWWNTDLILRQPDWLKEERGPDVSRSTRWIPLVTFMQLTADQFFGTTVPQGHGHNYGPTIVHAWENVVPPPGWTAAQGRALQELIDGL